MTWVSIGLITQAAPTKFTKMQTGQIFVLIIVRTEKEGAIVAILPFNVLYPRVVGWYLRLWYPIDVLYIAQLDILHLCSFQTKWNRDRDNLVKTLFYCDPLLRSSMSTPLQSLVPSHLLPLSKKKHPTLSAQEKKNTNSKSRRGRSRSKNLSSISLIDLNEKKPLNQRG